MSEVDKNIIEIGIGLRHPHYRSILEYNADIDFVEVHCENFFAQGGASQQLLRDVSQKYPLSFHGTSMGLGSLREIPAYALKKFFHLCEQHSPKLISDHACFSWGEVPWGDNESLAVHGGDLLPIVFDQAHLTRFVENVDKMQEGLKRKILIENLSAYLALGKNTMTETDFLNTLCDKTGCGLILDVNNLVVNARNNDEPLVETAISYIRAIDPDHVEEIHLAGCTPVADDEIMVDDHAQPVSESVWESYRFALNHLGPKPTLVEWDNNLPEFEVLVAEAGKARRIAVNTLSGA